MSIVQQEQLKIYINELVVNKVSENRTLEYKLLLPDLKSDKAKVEFLSDVCSFANSAGGKIIYGIKEERDKKNTGKPESIVGLKDVNLDQEILSMQQILDNGITPRIPGLKFLHEDDFEEGPVLVIDILKSWKKPHMVTYKDGRFHYRNDKGKTQMDFDQIRNAFLESEGIIGKVRRFLDERISNIITGDIPLEMLPKPKIVLHLAPIEREFNNINIDEIDREKLNKIPFANPNHTSFKFRYNLDGIVKYHKYPNELVSIYTQIFRDGSIESVDCTSLADRISNTIGASNILFNLSVVLDKYFDFLKTHKINTSYVIKLSFLNVKSLEIPYGGMRDIDHGKPIDRDFLILPEFPIERIEKSPDQILRPIFDLLWQAAGWPRCLDYDPEGKWKHDPIANWDKKYNQ